MVAACGGIAAQRIDETPFAVIDFETTGLSPGGDRVIEVAVVRVNPGGEPKLVFDSLINPQRPVAATEIHGITDADVADAPCFRDIAGDLVQHLSGCVVTAYNVYFDIKFLTHELGLAGRRHTPPHLCLMYFRPLLGLGKRCCLDAACELHGIVHESSHEAAADALASGQLLQIYLAALKTRSVGCFSELAALGNYKFLSSIENDPLDRSISVHWACGGRTKSRSSFHQSTIAVQMPQPVDQATVGLRKYWDALKMAVADLKITNEEIEEVRQLQLAYQLKDEQIRAMHARTYASVIAQFVEDKWVDDRERDKLRRFHSCLSELGWAPGE
jgi:DNA polymerase III epsilon subunit family exonuclease